MGNVILLVTPEMIDSSQIRYGSDDLALSQINTAIIAASGLNNQYAEIMLSDSELTQTLLHLVGQHYKFEITNCDEYTRRQLSIDLTGVKNEK